MQEEERKHLAGDYSGDAAATYMKRRFQSSKRMKKLHAMENEFADMLMTKIGTDAVVLDVPCGSGRFTNIFSGAKYLYSIDLSKDMLEQAKQSVDSDFRGEFLLASATELPLEDKSVDLVFCMRLLHHIAEPEVRKQILCELCRISRNLVATSFYRKETYRYYKKKMLGKKISGQPISMDLFKQEAMECGLRVLEFTPSKPLAYLNSSAQTIVLLEKTN